MTRVGGYVLRGVGHFGPRMKKFANLFRDATGEILVEGTLNVKMEREVPFREHFRIERLESDEWGWTGPMLFEICRIDGVWAYRIKGGHPPSIAEIASSRRIPKILGDYVELFFFGQ